MSGARELYIGNIKNVGKDEPTLPFGPMGLARVRKGVFGSCRCTPAMIFQTESVVGWPWLEEIRMDAAAGCFGVTVVLWKASSAARRRLAAWWQPPSSGGTESPG